MTKNCLNLMRKIASDVSIGSTLNSISAKDNPLGNSFAMPGNPDRIKQDLTNDFNYYYNNYIKHLKLQDFNPFKKLRPGNRQKYYQDLRNDFGSEPSVADELYDITSGKINL